MLCYSLSGCLTVQRVCAGCSTEGFVGCAAHCTLLLYYFEVLYYGKLSVGMCLAWLTSYCTWVLSTSLREYCTAKILYWTLHSLRECAVLELSAKRTSYLGTQYMREKTTVLPRYILYSLRECAKQSVPRPLHLCPLTCYFSDYGLCAQGPPGCSKRGNAGSNSHSHCRPTQAQRGRCGYN